MINDHEAFGQIAMTLAKHFDNLYYVDIETGDYLNMFLSRWEIR